MIDDDKTRILKELTVTLEVCGSELSDAALQAILGELDGYGVDPVIAALVRCRRELTGRLSLAAIIERIDDGRPGPEEAWAMLPKDEAETTVITDDMRRAMGPALSLLAIGDHVAARVAFIECYRRGTLQARAEGLPVRWVATLGHDKASRSGVLAEAVRDGRLDIGHALQLCGDSMELQVIANPALQIDGPKGEGREIPQGIKDLIEFAKPKRIE